MIKLLKYAKPFILPLLIAIALLYGQAMTDLALPDYMSNIVDIGIQMGGNEDNVPVVIEEDTYNRATLFLSEEDLTELGNFYELKEVTKVLKEEYTAIEGELVYVQTDSLPENLELAFAKAILAYSGIQSAILEAGDGEISLNGMTLPAGTDVFAMLAMMDPSVKAQMMAGSAEAFEAMGSDIVLQAANTATLSLYDTMGLDLDSLRSHYIIQIGLIMLGFTLLGAMASILVGLIASRIAAGLGRDLRSRIFNKVSQFSNTEFDQFSTASLITRSTNDVMQVQNLLVIMIRMVFYAPIIGIGGIIRALDKNSSMSWIIALAVGVLMLLIIVVFSIAMPKFKLVQKLVDKVNLVMRENLTGMMVIRAFNTQGFEEDRFDEANKELTDVNLFVNRVMVFMMPVMMFVMNGVTMLIIWVGSHEIANANMQVGDMMAFMQYAMQILMAFLMMSMMFIMIPRASVAANRIVEVLETDLSITDPENPKTLPAKATGTVAFNNVSFKYPGAEEAMLKNISFVAKPGETTAIIGSTGSGKTTLVNLIPRFYDVTEGNITLDGEDVRDLKQKDVRDHIGYIPQKASLFSGDIESNLLFAKDDATEAEMAMAIDTAQATEFVSGKEDGLKSHIAQGGGNVSGGQKQRLSIARALVKKPEVYIFDDSFSALDFKTDKALRKALKERTGESTLIIVAQRISTIKNAEQILVLDDGRLVGQGTHEELMTACETYQEIAYSQLSKEELA